MILIIMLVCVKVFFFCLLDIKSYFEIDRLDDSNVLWALYIRALS